ncbi:NAD-specific glutamate dehydrogenase [Streptomyces californicus]
MIHPQVTVRRDVTGKLIEVLSGGPGTPKPGAKGELPHDALVESWIHVEIDRETDRADLQQITSDLRRVLSDVREAVEDWQKMREAALRIADDLPGEPLDDLADEEVEEARELLRWLAADHFTFLGYREYELKDSDALAAVPGTGLGILRSDPHHSEDEAHPVSPSFDRLPADARAKARERELPGPDEGQQPGHRAPPQLPRLRRREEVRRQGQRRRRAALPRPLLLRRLHRVRAPGARHPPQGRRGRRGRRVLVQQPRRARPAPDPGDLPARRAVPDARRPAPLRRDLRALPPGAPPTAALPAPGRVRPLLLRDRLPPARPLHHRRAPAADRHPQGGLGGNSVDFTAWNTESILSRLHFVVRVPVGTELPHLTDADADRIEARLVEAARSWADGFGEALIAELGEERAAELQRQYGHSFPEGYKADHSPRAAVSDLVHLETLREGEKDFALSLYEPVGAGPGERFKIYRTGEQVSLSAVLPALQQLGVEVVDERPYELRCADRTHAWIYDFGLRMPVVTGNGGHLADDARTRFQEAFAAVWKGEAENDGFNALVLGAGLTWRQAMVLRAYAKYLRQAGAMFSQDYMESTLRNNVHTTRLLVSLFEARMSPGRQRAGTELTDGLLEELDGALDQVASLDEDRILRSFLTVIKATLRTNFFQKTDEGVPHSYVSVKFNPQAIPDLPAPRPAFEIWVYSPRVEGVHLRFGKVARGGLRWSDRREDFRTEVLGLVKAQMVKNTVIVPVGAKGGFVAKQLPDPSADRDAWFAEGIAAYRTFISALLDITDNMVAGEVVPRPPTSSGTTRTTPTSSSPPTRAPRASPTSPTRSPSRTASGSATRSPPAVRPATTTRAWASPPAAPGSPVKRHFRELGHDTQTEDFTVVGVGDMSGDVFGNGMLLSEHIRLVAAFDHRHIFIDPNPDAATSYAERRRLFDLPRSSSADYDTGLLSAGGGVHPRSAKSIPLNTHIREALGIDASVSKMTPADLMQAILKSPVDLVWNGGIGTYIKAVAGRNADVGDKANDAIRVNGEDLRAKVVGEGGNLGATQLGRIEFARSGGRIDTDAIDNSAGVDTSDHEVNIKILLNGLVRDGDMTVKQRNKLLADMTDEVGALVLRNNYAQNVALSNASAQAPSLLDAQQRFMRRLERDGSLDRALEFLPADRHIRELLSNGKGLTQPELAVLIAYTKIAAAGRS